jgi:hypothetical protein
MISLMLWSFSFISIPVRNALTKNGAILCDQVTFAVDTNTNARFFAKAPWANTPPQSMHLPCEYLIGITIPYLYLNEIGHQA